MDLTERAQGDLADSKAAAAAYEHARQLDPTFAAAQWERERIAEAWLAAAEGNVSATIELALDAARLLGS